MELITTLGNLVIPDALVGYNYCLFPTGRWWDFRKPSQQDDLDCCGAEVWHHDGDAPAIIVWSNMYPTEVKLSNGDIVVPELYDVVLLDNLKVEHRIPPALIQRVKGRYKGRYSMPQRYFIRSHLREKPNDETIERWRKAIVEKQRNLRQR